MFLQCVCVCVFVCVCVCVCERERETERERESVCMCERECTLILKGFITDSCCISDGSTGRLEKVLSHCDCLTVQTLVKELKSQWPFSLGLGK